jgi:hypothetical protein
MWRAAVVAHWLLVTPAVAGVVFLAGGCKNTGQAPSEKLFADTREYYEYTEPVLMGLFAELGLAQDELRWSLRNWQVSSDSEGRSARFVLPCQGVAVSLECAGKAHVVRFPRLTGFPDVRYVWAGNECIAVVDRESRVRFYAGDSDFQSDNSGEGTCPSEGVYLMSRFRSRVDSRVGLPTLARLSDATTPLAQHGSWWYWYLFPTTTGVAAIGRFQSLNEPSCLDFALYEAAGDGLRLSKTVPVACPEDWSALLTPEDFDSESGNLLVLHEADLSDYSRRWIFNVNTSAYTRVRYEVGMGLLLRCDVVAVVEAAVSRTRVPRHPQKPVPRSAITRPAASPGRPDHDRGDDG